MLIKNLPVSNFFYQLQFWRDYLALCKIKVIALMIVTSIIGMCLATPGWVDWQILVFGNLGIALCAASAAAINHLVDQHIDAKMARTFNRPLPSGRLTRQQVFVFSMLVGCLGMVILIIGVNTLVAWLTLASLLGYAVVYTLYLKRTTPQNIVIGGLAGAAPPLLGWVAVTGELHGYGLLLVLIIFAWTPPHFWALAVHRKKEYAAAEVPMLPVTHGEHFTNIYILFYTFLLVVATTLPFATGMLGLLYLCGASVLNIIFIYHALMMLMGSNKNSGMITFKYSIWYLFLLFILMLLDHYLFIWMMQ